MAQCQQLYELQKKAILKRGNKTPESKRFFVTRVAALGAKTEDSINESLFTGEKPNANNRNNQRGTRQSSANT